MAHWLFDFWWLRLVGECSKSGGIVAELRRRERLDVLWWRRVRVKAKWIGILEDLMPHFRVMEAMHRRIGRLDGMSGASGRWHRQWGAQSA